ncbi:hypothetical protein NE236_01990 [Actinoallomurus purpureus]|uniref:hypothetical protein n=1 Tax=Actinoallomurus purpureus TaxID=478114 RepID=UPI002091F48D|nr:hypothetical protein [Actinoallomurus purpureus]MCO6003739.1 hypothetical protein [Actinoallomurus purpureus]
MLISHRGLLRGAWVAVAGLLLVGCGTVRAGSPVRPPPAGQGTPTGTPPPSRTAPLSVPQETPRQGDGAPHYSENNGWKYRAPLSDEDTRLARAAADRIRPVLQRLLRENDLSVDSVERELPRLGHPRERVDVQPIVSHLMSTASPVPGAAYAVLVGRRACVDGGVRPGSFHLQIEGTIADGGCLEPFAH